MRSFPKLSKEEKVDFFVKCQSLLIEHHPESEFIFRYENLHERKTFVGNFIDKYKGYCYQDDNVCLLVNEVKIVDPANPAKSLKDHMYKEPVADYNGLTIDFVVFRHMTDCFDFVKTQDNPRIEYLLFVKNNQIKLYNKAKLVERLANVPLVAFLKT